MKNVNTHSLNPMQPPIPTPVPKAKNFDHSDSVASQVASQAVCATIIPAPLPVDRSRVTERNCLKITGAKITAASAAATAIAAGVTAHKTGQKHAQSEAKVCIEVYHQCKKEEFTDSDAIYALREYKISNHRIYKLLSAAGRVPPLKEGQKAVITENARGQFVASAADSKSLFARANQETPSQGESSSQQNKYQNTIEQSISTKDAESFLSKNSKSIVKGELMTNGQILILDERDLSEMNQAEVGQEKTYVMVKPDFDGSCGPPPEGDFSPPFTVLAALFFSLAALFGHLSWKFHLLDEEKSDVNSYESSIASHQMLNSTRKGAVDGTLLGILLQSQRKQITLEETRRLLSEKYSLSSNTIDEVLKNI